MQRNAQRNEELRQRYNDLLADENYKAQNCRLCPNCRRVVQHLSGLRFNGMWSKLSRR